jgi:hypothetical protein
LDRALRQAHYSIFILQYSMMAIARSPNRPILRAVLVLLLAAYLVFHFWPEAAGIQVQPAPDPLRGVLLVGIVEGGKDPDQYRKYEIRLNEGRIVLMHKQKISGADDRGIETPHRLGGEMLGCRTSPLVPSPDTRYTAYCFQTVDSSEGVFQHQRDNDFAVVDAATQRKVLAAALPQDRRIEGIFWAPNSRALALVSTTRRIGRGPLDLLFAIMGRPTPVVTTYVDTYDVSSKQHAEFLVRKDAEYGSGRIIDWQ